MTLCVIATTCESLCVAECEGMSVCRSVCFEVYVKV